MTNYVLRLQKAERATANTIVLLVQMKTAVLKQDKHMLLKYFMKLLA